MLEDLDGAPTRLYVSAALVPRLHQRLADDAFKLAEGGCNFWDRFQLIPVGERFWQAGHLCGVFAVDHHEYQSAFGIALAGRFLYTGDTRPIPQVLARFAGRGERVFHDCALHGSPSHTGAADLPKYYPVDLCRRLVLYHYESTQAAEALRAHGYAVAESGSRYPLMSVLTPTLRRVG